MMDCQDIQARLSAWVDGELEPDARDAVRAHVDSCPACRGLADDLTTVREAARSLGTVEPPDHVWLEVAGQVRLDAGPSADERFRTARSRASIQWLGLAAALIIVTLGVWVLSRPTAPGDEPAVLAGTTPTDEVTAELDLAMQHYERAIATLESMAASGDLPVDSAVTATLRDNLGVVDQAIAESRQALEESPNSQPARDSLFDALRQKVGLLQATVTLMNEVSKGDPGAALSATGSGRSS
jgi:anti-sigma factor RsiW